MTTLRNFHTRCRSAEFGIAKREGLPCESLSIHGAPCHWWPDGSACCLFVFPPQRPLRADAPPASWAELTAQRQRLGRQHQLLVAAGKTDEAVAVAEKLIAADRRILTLPAASDSEKKTQHDARLEAIEKLQGMVSQKKGREDWSAAAARQGELADLLAADRGASHYRVINARHERAYLETLATLKHEEARELVKAEENIATVTALDKQAKYGEAIPLAQSAANVQQQLLGKSSLKLATSLRWLGYLYCSQGDYAAGRTALCQAIEIRKTILGENHPDYADVLDNLASLYAAQGAVRGPNRCTCKPWKSRKRPSARTTPIMPACLNNLGGLCQPPRRLSAGREAFPSGLEIRKKAGQENQPGYATSLNNLAMLYYCQGEYARAEPLYLQVLDIRKRAWGGPP